jgi:hypothetical protein
MDPKGAAAHDARLERLLKLRKRLKNMSLSAFTVNDLPALIRVTSLVSEYGDPTDEDMDLLERRLA